MRVTADRDRCMGAGSCVSIEPSVFDQDEEDGLVLVLAEHPATSARSAVTRAVRMCPARALEVRDE